MCGQRGTSIPSHSLVSRTPSYTVAGGAAAPQGPNLFNPDAHWHPMDPVESCHSIPDSQPPSLCPCGVTPPDLSLPASPPLPLPLQLLMQWLAKLAIMSGRVPVWPTVDCSAGYAAGIPQDMMKTPLEVPRGWFPYWSHSWKKIHCFRASLVRGWMPGSEGLAPPLFSHLEGIRRASRILPARDNRLKDLPIWWRLLSASSLV